MRSSNNYKRKHRDEPCVLKKVHNTLKTCEVHTLGTHYWVPYSEFLGVRTPEKQYYPYCSSNTPNIKSLRRINVTNRS